MNEKAIDPRFDYEADDLVQKLIGPEDLCLSAEEYAARRAHLWLCFSFHLCRFRDPVLGAWVKRFGELFDSPEEVEQLRERILTREERERIESQMAEEF